MQQSISYRKVRDLGGVFSASFGFIKANFRPFYGSLFLFAGPFVLIYSTVASITLRSLMSLVTMRNFGSSALLGLAAAYFFAIVVMLIGVSVYNVILNKSIVESENLPDGHSLSVKTIMNGFFNSYWRVVGNMLLFFLLSLIISVSAAFIFYGLFSLFFGAGTAIGVIFVFLLFCAMFIFIPVLSYIPMAALFVCQRDSINIFMALGKVFRYMKNNFWYTWVVSFIALLTYSVMAMMAQLPAIIVNLVTSFSRLKSTVGYGAAEESTPLLLVVVTAFCALLSFGVMSVYYLMCIYHYGSLEEKNEGTSVLEKINKIS